MIESDLGDLECIHCHNELSFHKIIHKEEKVIRTAVVSCSGCSRKFAILEYVLIMLSSTDAKQLLPDNLLDEYVVLISNCDDDSSYVTNKAMRSGANWKKQFAGDFIVTKYSLDSDGFWGAQAFWNFCGLEPSQINNQDIMVYCGGTGRETYHLLAAEPTRVFVLDLGSHLFNIPSLCQPHISKLVLILSDFYFNPIKPNTATISICDHALQHIEDNKSAFRYIVDNTKEGGMISICVYSHENNIIVTHMIEPSKRVLHKLNLEWQKRSAFFPAVFLYAIYTVSYLINFIWSQRTSSSVFLST